MGRLSKTMVIIALALCFSAAAISPAEAASDKPIKWRMCNLYPRGISFGPLYQEFCDMVGRMSGGRLIIDCMYDGEGVGAMEVWSSVKSGLIEMGAPYMALHAGEFPAGVVGLGLPGGPTDLGQLLALWHDAGWLEAINEGAKKQGIMILAEYYQPGTYVLSKEPIKSIEDFKKLKIRCPGAYGKMMRKLGASPAVIAFGETYTSLATGVVDAVDGCNLIDHRDGKFYEVAKYMYPLPLSGSQVGPLIVNLNAFNSLPADLQEILKVAGYYHGMLQAYKSVVWEKEALKEMKAKGLLMSPEPSQQDKAKWKEAGLSVWPEYENLDETSKKMIDIQRKFLE